MAGSITLKELEECSIDKGDALLRLRMADGQIIRLSIPGEILDLFVRQIETLLTAYSARHSQELMPTGTQVTIRTRKVDKLQGGVSVDGTLGILRLFSTDKVTSDFELNRAALLALKEQVAKMLEATSGSKH